MTSPTDAGRYTERKTTFWAPKRFTEPALEELPYIQDPEELSASKFREKRRVALAW